METYLMDRGYPAENLDGDEIRQNLHPDLGFTREERLLNNRRTAFICKLLNRNDIPVVTGMITPFREGQREARNIIEPDGDFVLIYVKCSLDECERRDPKNLYEQARAGKIDNFTGVSHPFQEPHQPDVIVDTEDTEIEKSFQHVKRRLDDLGVLAEGAEGDYGIDLSREDEAQIKQRLSDMGYLDEK
jgi:adenylylsulfate kinase